ncbi:MAG: prepilin-type N-terminal cleavage/methylation domain-containing protein, partial [Deltaproteobacteria bacterium]|nr:prepilin-type N-terminal cleavage/methylation domain-containing protein [Deltaproteobacteria bacterium]
MKGSPPIKRVEVKRVEEKTGLRQDAGLSLVELMIAMLLFAILAAGVMLAVMGSQKTMASQQRTNSTVDNARSTLNVIARQVRMALAGTGKTSVVIVNDTTSRAWHGSNGGLVTNTTCVGTGAVPALYVVDGGATGSDILAIFYPEGGAWGALSKSLDESDTNVTVRTRVPPPPAAATPLPLSIRTNDWVLVSNFKRALAVQATSAATLSGGDYTFSKAAATSTYFVNPITPGAFVTKASWLAYRVNPTFFGNDPVIEVLDLATVNANLNAAGQIGEPAATGIEDLQVALGIDGLNGNPVDGQLTEVGGSAGDDE